jgi:hypothetical protein
MARYYSRFLPDLFAAAQRFRIDSAILFLAAADIMRVFLGPPAGAGLFLVPGGRPRRLAGAEFPPLIPSNARIAAPSLLRSSLSCCTIS